MIQTAPLLIKAAGFVCVTHTATTPDGYQLGLHRIPSPGPPIVVWHGLSTCSDMFVAGGQQSLAFVLSLKGYDVWLANSRGTIHSEGHTTLKGAEYWDYGMDEMVEDVVTVVDYVLDKTGRRSLSYIGFSQGTALVFAALSIHDCLNDKINLVVGLAPALKPKRKSDLHPLTPLIALTKALANQHITSLIAICSPTVLYYLFGNKSFLSTGQTMKVYGYVNKLIVRNAIKGMLDWKLERFGDEDRHTELYRSVYSSTSVKNLVVRRYLM